MLLLPESALDSPTMAIPPDHPLARFALHVDELPLAAHLLPRF